MEIKPRIRNAVYIAFCFLVLLVPYTLFAPGEWYVADAPGKPIDADKQPPVEKQGDLVRVPIFLTTSGGVAIGMQIVWKYDPFRFQVTRVSLQNSPFYVTAPGLPAVRTDIGEIQIAGATRRPGWQSKGVIGFIEGYTLQSGVTQLLPDPEKTKLWVRNGDDLQRVDLPMETITIGGDS